MRNIIFGGTFDPVHNGHLEIARCVLDRGLADRVVFVPCAIPSHKDAAQVSGCHRLYMVKLAIALEPKMSVSDVDLEHGDVTYMIDTVRRLGGASERPLLLIGSDSLNYLHLWHRAYELVDKCDFLIYARSSNPPMPCEEMTEKLGHAAVSRLFDSIIADAPEFDVSSTEIRERVSSGRSMKGLLPEAVERYITGHNLYSEKSS